MSFSKTIFIFDFTVATRDHFRDIGGCRRIVKLFMVLLTPDINIIQKKKKKKSSVMDGYEKILK